MADIAARERESVSALEFVIGQLAQIVRADGAGMFDLALFGPFVLLARRVGRSRSAQLPRATETGWRVVKVIVEETEADGSI